MTMPAVLRRSGPDIQMPDGTIKTPRAVMAWCDTCGAENAAFSETADSKTVRFCGWDRATMKPICKGRGAGKEE